MWIIARPSRGNWESKYCGSVVVVVVIVIVVVVVVH